MIIYLLDYQQIASRFVPRVRNDGDRLGEGV
jgi:hypothetical protein